MGVARRGYLVVGGGGCSVCCLVGRWPCELIEFGGNVRRWEDWDGRDGDRMGWGGGHKTCVPKNNIRGKVIRWGRGEGGKK